MAITALKISRKAALSGGIVLILIAAGIIFHQQILWNLGAWLTDSEPPQKADAVVVLGGDSTGRRTLTAAELVRQGFAPRVLVSGAKGYWGHHESYYDIQFAAEHGYSPDIFVPVTYPALATRDEAANDVAEIRKMGMHKILLVTSIWHTARAVRIFRRLAPDLEIHGVGSEDPHWHHGHWWADREGAKVWFAEAQKTIANRLGI